MRSGRDFLHRYFSYSTSTWVEPIFADYENYRLYELPPNGQGIAALEMVQIQQQSVSAAQRRVMSDRADPMAGPFSQPGVGGRCRGETTEVMALISHRQHRFRGSNISPPYDGKSPTYFYPRAHRRVFSFTVPSDFGDRRAVWNLTVRGEQLRAVGWLESSWETGADAPGGRQLSDEAARNTAPGIAVDPPSSVTVQSGATLRARVTDDGLPVQRERGDADRGPGSNDPPTLQADPDAVEAPHNVPAVPNRRGGGGGADGPRVRGLRVSWSVWRGPAGVSFEPNSTVAVEDGQAVVTATFTTPGDYVLRAVANDDRLTTEHDVTVTVR